MGIHEKIDELEVAMLEYPPGNYPVGHAFTPGLYTRSIFMPAGHVITSLIHKTEHPFFILQGVVKVRINDGEVQRLEAPYFGITQPGTRRVLFIEQDCIWITSHANPNDETVEQIMDRIIDKRENPLLDGVIINNVITKTIENES